jgi:hypothetical protein
VSMFASMTITCGKFENCCLFIRDQLRRILKIPNFIPIEYKTHNDSLNDRSSFRNPNVVHKVVPAPVGSAVSIPVDPLDKDGALLVGNDIAGEVAPDVDAVRAAAVLALPSCSARKVAFLLLFWMKWMFCLLTA